MAFQNRGQDKKGSNSKRRAGIVSAVLFLAGCLAGTYAPTSSAQVSASNIEFLNPSSFASGGETGIIVSNRRPSRPEEGDETYRLSAWVSNPPANAAVEFELLRSGISLATIDAVTKVGSDTWEADWAIPPSIPDGPYTMRATLASGNLGVDSVDQDITIARLAERVEMTYPSNRGGDDGKFGTFAPLATSTGTQGGTARPGPIGNIDGLNTGESDGSGTSRVRAFYSVSQPGSRPAWIACGTEAAPGDALLSGAANNGVRCTLQSAAHQAAVTAVALLANNSNRGSYDPRLNQSGDATRVVQAYAQTPGNFSVVGDSDFKSDEVRGSFSCELVEGKLVDQNGREIAGANVDVHAFGPSDKLKFDTGPLPEYDWSTPDRRNHARELGYDCFGAGSDRETPGEQGEHQVVAGPDIKHLESDPAGTTDEGLWGFEVKVPAEDVSDSRFTTNYLMWVDETNDGTGVNDDGCASSELTAFGHIGWGKEPTLEPLSVDSFHCQAEPPVTECPDTGEAASSEGCPTTSPSPSPTSSPSSSPTSDPSPSASPSPSAGPADEARLSIGVTDQTVRSGAAVWFSGRLRSSVAPCQSQRTIKLQMRALGSKKFRTRALGKTSDSGRWAIRHRVRRTSIWRAVVPRSNECSRVRSKGLRIQTRK